MAHCALIIRLISVQSCAYRTKPHSRFKDGKVPMFSFEAWFVNFSLSMAKLTAKQMIR